eukprot:TRINITY_DN2059_c1_g1_i3.p1 TRINITY_DN2059_c1_g1~~TRINITY_DN2059_c1_g1_i3.p1  ORF type:complete len:147 (-),score=39.68 TRINITY_DN2059_c1_g1_i3:58-498(-)
MSLPGDSFTVWDILDPIVAPLYDNVALVWCVFILLVVLWVSGVLKDWRIVYEEKKREFLDGTPNYDDPQVVDEIRRQRALMITKAQKEQEEASQRFLKEQEELRKLKEERENERKDEGPSVHFGGASGGSHWKPPQRKCGPSGCGI